MPRGDGLRPRTEREWRLYHLGFIEGVEKAQFDARSKAELFATRSKCNGVELEFPSWPPPTEPPASFTPQLKRRRNG